MSAVSCCPEGLQQSLGSNTGKNLEVLGWSSSIRNLKIMSPSVFIFKSRVVGVNMQLLLTLIDCRSGDIGNMIYENSAYRQLDIPWDKLSVDRVCRFRFPESAVSTTTQENETN